jgi:hypothetical protein
MSGLKVDFLQWLSSYLLMVMASGLFLISQCFRGGMF